MALGIFFFFLLLFLNPNVNFMYSLMYMISVLQTLLVDFIPNLVKTILFLNAIQFWFSYSIYHNQYISQQEKMDKT